MVRRLKDAALVLTLLQHAPTPPALAQVPPPHVVPLGTCRFADGTRISNCRVAYRAFGQLNQAHTNVVLIPTWMLGRSEDWIPFLGPAGYVDTTRFYAVVVDALGNGRSSSPSTVRAQDREAFRGLTIGDMVESQHRLLTEHLRVTHLHAVIGFSMGGMQALEWAVRFPDFADLVVSIAGSPRIGAFDKLLWSTLLAEIETAKRSHTPTDSVWAQLTRLETLFLRTPRATNHMGWDSVRTEVAEQTKTYRRMWALDDYEAQMRAVHGHDIALSGRSDLSDAARTVRAKMLIVHSPDDHMVTAAPAFAFARMIGADTVSIPAPCGHLAFLCQQEQLSNTVRRFLAQ